MCFGCGKDNPIGLKLKFHWDGRHARGEFTPQPHHQGWSDVVHGGILLTILDEAMSYAAIFHGSYCVTARMETRLKRPARVGERLLITSQVNKHTKRLVEAEAEIKLGDGSAVASGKATMFVVSQKEAGNARPGEGREARGVIWDMDGVLVDSAASHFQAWREAFAEKEVDFTQADFRRIFGQKNERIIRDFLGDKITEEEIEPFSLKKEERFRQLLRHDMQPLPGVAALLKALRAHGFRMAIASSAPLENVEMTASGLGIRQYFDALVSAEDVSEGKPHPQVFLLAAQKLGTPPARCVVVEDAIAGIAACKAAGAHCLAVTNTNSRENLPEADLVVDSLEKVGVEDFARLIDSKTGAKMERTLVIIKPDAMQRNLAATILSRIEQQGMKLAALRMLQIDRKLAEKHYGVHKDKPFYKDLVDYIISTPVVAAVFAGENAINAVRNIMGPTNPAKAPKGTIRGDFGVDIQRNSVHGSDSPTTAAEEIKLYFTGTDIFE